MDFDIASQASAIDDSFLPIIQTPASAAPSGYSDAPYGSYPGPRSGHWTVSSGRYASGIDDRNGTILGARAPSDCGSYGFARVRPIGKAILRKLAIATDAEKRARQKQEDVQREQQQPTSAYGWEPSAKPKSDKVNGFYVPRPEDSRGIRIRDRNGQDEVVKEPTYKPVILPTPPPVRPKAAEPVEEEKKPPTPPASVKSAASHASKRSNLVRIVGKNGEEAFVQLPVFGHSSGPLSATPSQNQGAATIGKQDFSPVPDAPSLVHTSDTIDRAKQNAAAEKEAKRLRDERVAAEAKRIQDEKAAVEAKKKREERAAAEAKRLREQEAAAEKKRLHDEKFAKEAVMHGALQPPSNALSAVKSARASKSSSKGSEKQYPGVFDPVSKPPSSASSTTSVSKPASQQQNQGNGAWGQASSHRSRPGTTGWHEVGFGTYEPAASKNRSGRQHNSPPAQQRIHASPQPDLAAWGGTSQPINRTKPSRNSPASNQWGYGDAHRSPSNSRRQVSAEYQPPFQVNPAEAPEASQRSNGTVDSFPIVFPPLNNDQAYPHPQQQSSGNFDHPFEGPTVFAGRGWISPHPLSEAPTWARSDPDPHIHLPPGATARTESGVQTMTYEEWLAVQNQTDTASKVQTMVSSAHQPQAAGGCTEDFGRRNWSRTSSHASRQCGGGSWGHRAGGVERLKNYHTPTVKTESDAGNQQQQPSVRSQRGGSIVAGHFGDGWGNTKTQLKMPWDNQHPGFDGHVSDKGSFCF